MTIRAVRIARARAAVVAVLALATTGLLACSRPTAVPTQVNVGPGPFITITPPSGESYPPLMLATKVPPYPEGQQPTSEAGATTTVTATGTVTQ